MRTINKQNPCSSIHVSWETERRARMGKGRKRDKKMK